MKELPVSTRLLNELIETSRRATPINPAKESKLYGFLRVYIVIIFLYALMNTFIDTAGDVGFLNEVLEESGEAIVTLILISIGLYLTRDARDYLPITITIYGAVGFLCIEQLLDVTDEFTPLNDMVLLGEGSKLNNIVQSLARNAGLCCLFCTAFFAMRLLGSLHSRLSDSEEKFRFLAEHTAAGIMIFNDGKCTYSNSSAKADFDLVDGRYGNSDERSVDVSNLPLDVRVMLEERSREGKAELEEQREIEVSAKDGKKKWLQVIVDSLPGSRDRGVLITTLDTTEAKLAERERERLRERVYNLQKTESLSVLAGGIAHRFNNLLTRITANVSLVLEEIPTDSPLRANHLAIERAAEEASGLSKKMLGYSGKGRFLDEEIQLNNLIDDEMVVIESILRRGTKVRLNLDDETPPVRGDIQALKRMVGHLIANATEAIGDDGGEIRLTTGPSERDSDTATKVNDTQTSGQSLCAFIEVTDTGTGMESKVRERIFDPFFTTRETGRGLGLSAVLGIVRSHEGTIEVDSCPNEGSTFRVFFPAAANSAKSPAGLDGEQELKEEVG